jgi:uncharacterized protein YprB with RNaseH-like and TPR domain
MEILKSVQIENVLFIDIETVPAVADFTQLPEEWKGLWEKKARTLTKTDESADELYKRAGIYAEFGKIVCIGVGVLRRGKDGLQLRVKSIQGHHEAELLQEFADLLNRSFGGPSFLLCAHNGKEFDFPFLARRMMVNGIKLPRLLDMSGKKPWDIPHIDTMELWKFGDFKSFTSLNLLAHLFGIPTPKDDIDGSMVWSVYWEENNLERIARYCAKDVVTLVQLFLKFRGEKMIENDDIVIAES